MIQMELSRIIISETNDEQVIVLKEVDGPRAFPIVIGIWEAVAIDRNLKGKKTPRPMTQDGTLVDIDSRPSDAIALAVQMQVPIFVAPSVLEDVTPGTGIGGLSEHGPEDEGEDSEEDEVI